MGIGGRDFLKNRKFNVRRHGGPRRQVNPRVTRVKIVRLCLHNQEKPAERINHRDPNLGAVCTLKNSFVYTAGSLISSFLQCYLCSHPHLLLQDLQPLQFPALHKLLPGAGWGGSLEVSHMCSLING